jgi:uncharacterized protein
MSRTRTTSPWSLATLSAAHSGRNELRDGRRYDNNYCWVFHFQDGLVNEVREYMDTQVVTDTFGEDDSA